MAVEDGGTSVCRGKREQIGVSLMKAELGASGVLTVSEGNLRTDSLVLYKIHPARVLAVGDKIEIGLGGGQIKRVRPKDVVLLHPGPLRSLDELEPRAGELEEAWELLEGGATNLAELAELVYDEFTPASAWAAWQLVADGLLFRGSPDAIRARGRDEVAAERAERQAKEAARRDWDEFLARMSSARPAAQDAERLAEVERLAEGKSAHSRILRALGHQETRENAHRALVQVGYWEPNHNPYPARNGLPGADPSLPVGEMPDEKRLDLTHLPAYAIDDEGNRDPDDAVSLDGDRLWVHVADVAALVPPDGPLDREARARGCNHYLPERTVNMLPGEITARLGLGLQEVSPALSIGFRCDGAGALADIDIHRSWVRVTRKSYEEVQACIDDEPFRGLEALVEPFRGRRHANDAAGIELPEVNVRVRAGEVVIRPLPRLRSRELVMDAMLMAGEAAALFCRERGIPIAYATQPAPDKVEQPGDLAAMYAYRRRFKPTRLVSEPGPHFGLGLPIYARATSPLRRYSDLLLHQQVRAFLGGETLIDAQQVAARVAEAETSSAAVRRAERLSNQHWKLVYLRDNPDWRGSAVVVAKEEHKSVLLIPELALETRVRLRSDPPLNSRLLVRPRDVDLPDLTCGFRVQE